MRGKKDEKSKAVSFQIGVGRKGRPAKEKTTASTRAAAV